MKILLAPSSYPPVLGGVQTVVEEVALGLLDEGYTVKVLTNRVPLRLPASEVRKGVPVHRLWFASFRPSEKKIRSIGLFILGLLVAPFTFLRLWWIIATFKPDVINLHHPQSMIPYFRAITRMYKVKVITSLHGYDLECFVQPDRRSASTLHIDPKVPGRKRMKTWLEQSDALITNSNYMSALSTLIAPNFNRDKIHVLYNGIDPSRFNLVTQKTKEQTRPYIYAFGRCDQQKGFDLLLEAYALIAHRFPYDLWLSGDGPDRVSYQAFIEKKRLSDRIKLTGRATPEEISTYLSNAEFVVVPSRWEAFGITVLEALAAGKAVIATNVGGIPEFATFQYCMICEPYVGAIATGLERLSQTPLKVDVLQKQQYEVWKNYTWKGYMKQYIRIIETVAHDTTYEPTPL